MIPARLGPIRHPLRWTSPAGSATGPGHSSPKLFCRNRTNRCWTKTVPPVGPPLSKNKENCKKHQSSKLNNQKGRAALYSFAHYYLSCFLQFALPKNNPPLPAGRQVRECRI